jgi:hypothetical protein
MIFKECCKKCSKATMGNPFTEGQWYCYCLELVLTDREDKSHLNTHIRYASPPENCPYILEQTIKNSV